MFVQRNSKILDAQLFSIYCDPIKLKAPTHKMIFIMAAYRPIDKMRQTDNQSGLKVLAKF